MTFSPLLLSENDACTFLGKISETKLREIKIPRRKLGRRRFYDRRDLEAYVDSLAYDNEEESPADPGEQWLNDHG